MSRKLFMLSIVGMMILLTAGSVVAGGFKIETYNYGALADEDALKVISASSKVKFFADTWRDSCVLPPRQLENTNYWLEEVNCQKGAIKIRVNDLYDQTGEKQVGILIARKLDGGKREYFGYIGSVPGQEASKEQTKQPEEEPAPKPKPTEEANPLSPSQKLFSGNLPEDAEARAPEQKSAGDLQPKVGTREDKILSYEFTGEMAEFDRKLLAHGLKIWPPGWLPVCLEVDGFKPLKDGKFNAIYTYGSCSTKAKAYQSILAAKLFSVNTSEKRGTAIARPFRGGQYQFFGQIFADSEGQFPLSLEGAPAPVTGSDVVMENALVEEEEVLVDTREESPEGKVEPKKVTKPAKLEEEGPTEETESSKVEEKKEEANKKEETPAAKLSFCQDDLWPDLDRTMVTGDDFAHAVYGFVQGFSLLPMAEKAGGYKPLAPISAGSSLPPIPSCIYSDTAVHLAQKRLAVYSVDLKKVEVGVCYEHTLTVADTARSVSQQKKTTDCGRVDQITPSAGKTLLGVKVGRRDYSDNVGICEATRFKSPYVPKAQEAFEDLQKAECIITVN
ncbi:hypothetical protein HYV44_02890 [Candidatus Microgenomates bacterium]|nr:hypothetical protein [Candidatus Microgenomates bacterium]